MPREPAGIAAAHAAPTRGAGRGWERFERACPPQSIRSKRSRVTTFVHAATKSCTSLSPPSSAA